MAAAVKGKKERSADERVLEAIFNPEDPLGGEGVRQTLRAGVKGCLCVSEV